jgi:hypothetical protein
VHRDGVRGNLQRVRQEQVAFSDKHLRHSQKNSVYYEQRYAYTKNIMFIVIVSYCGLIPICS